MPECEGEKPHPSSRAARRMPEAPAPPASPQVLVQPPRSQRRGPTAQRRNAPAPVPRPAAARPVAERGARTRRPGMIGRPPLRRWRTALRRSQRPIPALRHPGAPCEQAPPPAALPARAACCYLCRSLAGGESSFHP